MLLAESRGGEKLRCGAIWVLCGQFSDFTGYSCWDDPTVSDLAGEKLFLPRVRPEDWLPGVDAGRQNVVKAVMMPSSNKIAKSLGVWLLWSLAAALITACIASFASAQQPTEPPSGLPTTEPPSATAEEMPQPQAVQAPAGPNESAPAESVPAGTVAAIPTGANVGQAEAPMPDGQPAAGLPEGFAIPPTASTRDWFNFHDWYTQDDFTLLNHPKDRRNMRLLFDFDSLQNQFFTRIWGWGSRRALGSRLAESSIAMDRAGRQLGSQL